jgi:hypothetical protein
MPRANWTRTNPGVQRCWVRGDEADEEVDGAGNPGWLALNGGCQHLPREAGGEHERLQLERRVYQPEHAERDLDASSGGPGPLVLVLGGRAAAAGEAGVVAGDRVGHKRSSRFPALSLMRSITGGNIVCKLTPLRER